MSVNKNFVFLRIIPRDEFPSFRFAHLISAIVFGARDWSNIIPICLRVEIVGYQDLVTVSPKASGRLRSAIGRNAIESKNVRCSIVIRQFSVHSELILESISEEWFCLE